MSSESKVLEKLFPQLCKFLNTDEVKPYLVESGAISLGECEELQLGANPSISTQSKLAEKTVIVVSRHPQCATKLLEALERTDSANNKQSSHYQLVLALREEIDKTLAYCGNTTLWHVQQRGPSSEEDVSHHDGPYYHQPNQRNTTDAAATSVDTNKGKSNEPVELLQYDYLASKDSEKLRVKLVQQSLEIIENFASFTVSVGDLLVSKSVTPDRVATLLRYRLGSKNIDEDTHKSMKESNTVHGLLSAVEPFSSWFNYDLIALVAKRLGGEEGQKLVDLYESQLQIYFHRLVFECPPFSSLKSIPDDFEEMSVKVDWDYKECTVQDITIFKSKLCKFLKRDDPSLFILKRVDEGCVVLNLIFPSAITADVIFEVQACCSQLRDENVQYVRVGTKIISCDRQTSELPQTEHPKTAAYVETLPLSEVAMQSLEPAADQSQVDRASNKPNVSHQHSLTFKPKADVFSPLVSPSSDRSPSPLLTDQKVQLREKKSLSLRSRLLAAEHRKSSGYYSPVGSFYADSPYSSQRSSWAADYTHSQASSGYNSPIQSERTSLVDMAEEEEDYYIEEYGQQSP